MKPFVIAMFSAALLLGGRAGAQTVMEHSQALKPVIAPAQIIGPERAQVQPPGIHDSLTSALAKTGKFNTFLALLKVAGMDDWEKAGIQDDSVRGVTVLAPNDAAFAAMDKAKLGALMKDSSAARGFVMAHVVPGALTVNDMLDPGNPLSIKQFKGLSGGEFKMQCDARPHVGLHHPRINGGTARVGDVQDVPFSGGMVQEIDGVLVP